MMPVLVESNVILDVATNDAAWAIGSGEALAEEAVLVINPIIHGKVSIGYERIEDLEAALGDGIHGDLLPWEAAFSSSGRL